MAAKKKFIVCWTECGSAEQIEGFGAYTTLKAAKEAVADHFEENGPDTDTWVIAEVLEVGRPTGMVWSKTASLS